MMPSLYLGVLGALWMGRRDRRNGRIQAPASASERRRASGGRGPSRPFARPSRSCLFGAVVGEFLNCGSFGDRPGWIAADKFVCREFLELANAG